MRPHRCRFRLGTTVCVQIGEAFDHQIRRHQAGSRRLIRGAASAAREALKRTGQLRTGEREVPPELSALKLGAALSLAMCTSTSNSRCPNSPKWPASRSPVPQATARHCKRQSRSTRPSVRLRLPRRGNSRPAVGRHTPGHCRGSDIRFACRPCCCTTAGPKGHHQRPLLQERPRRSVR
jgi:hypothetical protein